MIFLRVTEVSYDAQGRFESERVVHARILEDSSMTVALKLTAEDDDPAEDYQIPDGFRIDRVYLFPAKHGAEAAEYIAELDPRFRPLAEELKSHILPEVSVQIVKEAPCPSSR